ncbi:hypothetical protein TNCV_1686151 [Trichonephila clavipes]|nr:hypothetical protein TNCV_1686151 [Trichonephila clavipes]
MDLWLECHEFKPNAAEKGPLHVKRCKRPQVSSLGQVSGEYERKMTTPPSHGHENKQGTQQLDTRPGCEETQVESIRTSPESIVVNGVALTRERKTKLTPVGGGATVT